jgi:hypothetical protein
MDRAAGARLEPLRSFRSGFDLTPIAALEVGRVHSPQPSALAEIAAGGSPSTRAQGGA